MRFLVIFVCSEWVYNLNFRRTFGTRFFNLLVWEKHLFPKKIGGGFSLPTSYYGLLYVEWLKSYENFSDFGCSEWVYNLNFRRTFGTQLFNLLVWEKHLFPKKIGGGFSYPTWGEVGGSVCPSVRPSGDFKSLASNPEFLANFKNEKYKMG